MVAGAAASAIIRDCVWVTDLADMADFLHFAGASAISAVLIVGLAAVSRQDDPVTL